jgi:hypothetical protein
MACNTHGGRGTDEGLVVKPETKELVEVEMARYEDNIKIDFKEFGS